MCCTCTLYMYNVHVYGLYYCTCAMYMDSNIVHACTMYSVYGLYYCTCMYSVYGL